MRCSIHGFSLPELLIVIAMISIVSSAFLNSDSSNFFDIWLARQANQQEVDGLLTLIERARSLSVQSGKEVRLCGGEHCDGNWSEQASLRFASSTIERHFFQQNTRIRWQGFPPQRRYILFLPTGLSSYQNGSFYICNENSQAQRLLMNQSGRAYLDDQSYEVSKCL
ncbi:GspH/FimT family pseudopilin [Marinomonas gallaica]|uniref:GspH/FimT family pseudopilin n=1 Tax=Marinomonas gallaica TaxID=1806667 RepID=UPI003CE460DF